MATAVLELESMAKRELSEIERQEKVVSDLGNDFQFPLFNGRNAIESQRKSAYKNTPRAAREIVDNAYEAGAKNVWIVLQRHGDKGRDKNQRRNSVCDVAFIDDGPGMIDKMARYALSWGGGSHFEQHEGIGRFGFGLPNSSINQTRRVEVYTRTTTKAPWKCASLDITPEALRDIPSSGQLNVDEPEEADLPDFVKDYLTRNKIKLSTGTVVC